MPFEIAEGPYTIEGIMESIRVQVIEPEAEPHADGEGEVTSTAPTHFNPDAPRPLVEDGTPVSALLSQLELMRQRQNIQPEYIIQSHRPLLGIVANYLKKFVFWGSRPYINLLREKQEAFNEAALHAVRETSYQLDLLQGQAAGLSRRLSEQMELTQNLNNQLQGQRTDLEQVNKRAWEGLQRGSDLTARLETLDSGHALLVTEHWKTRDELLERIGDLREKSSTLLRRHDLNPFFAGIPEEQRLAAMDVTRGTFDDITQRQKVYLELLKNRPGHVVDLGCGRGELLHMLRTEGFGCWGAELEPAMIHAARSLGNHIEEVDAITALASVKPASLGGIFAAQLVEHLFPGELLQLLRLARRQLAPGGIIILETVNAASPAAFSKSYTRDLDHKLPLHPEYLKLLLETAGFEQVTLNYSAPFEPHERLKPLPPADELGLTPAAHAELQARLKFLDEFLFGNQDFYVTGLQGKPTSADEPIDLPTAALHV